MYKYLIALFCLIIISNISFAQNEAFQLRQVACDLEQPWEVTYGPDNHLWVTESRDYKLLRINPATGAISVALDATNLKNFPNNQNPWPQGGFTGVALHPDLLTGKPYVYVAYTYQFDGCLPNDQGCFFKTKIERYTYNSNTGSLTNGQTVLDNIPGSNDHNGGRLKISEVVGVPSLFYTVGDMGAGQFGNAERVNNAQDPNVYEGKILRLLAEPVGGSYIPSGNPFGNAVWTLGHRNPQGLAFGPNGNMYAAEHGPWTDDEINNISIGGNYGHPLVSGFADGNYNGVAVGTGSLLPIIASEQNNANSLTAYEDPIASYYAAPGSEVTDWYNYAVAGTQPFPNAWLFRPSIAPSGIEYYGENAIPNWNNSLLVTSLKKSIIYRQPLQSVGGTLVEPIPMFEGLGRFRDVAVSPDGTKIYVVCDKYGATSGPTQGTSISPNNPGCVLEFEYAPNLTGCQNSYDGFTFIGDYNDAKYFISDATSNWANGSSLAEFYGGYLASPNDAAENEFLRTYLAANNEIAFIGVTDGNTEGTFELSSGETTTYNNFTGTNSTNDNYGIMNFWDGTWGVNNITTQRRYIIEIPCSACTDNDNDGVCANVDCDDNNPNLPTTPGTTCFDGDPVTINDVILADGCTCEGTIPSGGLTIECPDDITVQIPAGSTTITANWPNASGTANCTGGLLGPVQIGGPQPGTQVSAGTYTITYNVYNQCNESLNCSFTATVEQTNTNCNVAIILSSGSISISGLTSAENAVLYDSNIDPVWNCNPWNGNLCTGNEAISNLSAGEYFLSVQSDACSEWIPITVQGGCVDADNDGVCADEDCDDNNANIPTAPGTSCDDNDPDTIYDEIQADGCTCDGLYYPCNINVDLLSSTCNGSWLTYTVDVVSSSNTNSLRVWVATGPNDSNSEIIQSNGTSTITTYIGTNTGPFTSTIFDSVLSDCEVIIAIPGCQNQVCNVAATTLNDVVNITGLTGAENAVLYDSNIDPVWNCNPWNGNLCTGNEVISNLSAGEYFLSVQSDACSEWIPITVQGGCVDADNDGVCADDDCDDTDPSIPTAPGTVCDVNPFFVEVIKEDGCTCEGVIMGIDCPGNITLQIPTGATTVTGSWQIPVGITDCPNGAFQAVQLNGPTLGDQLTAGVYNLGYLTGNSCNQNADCYFSVTVVNQNAGCNVAYTTGNGFVTVTGLTAAENAKLFDANIDAVWECNPWNGIPCSGNEVISGLASGQYYLSVQSGVCDEWIPITVQGGGVCELNSTISNVSCTAYSITYDIIVTGTNTSGNKFARDLIQGSYNQLTYAEFDLNVTHTITEVAPVTGTPVQTWNISVYDPADTGCGAFEAINCPAAGCNVTADEVSGDVVIYGLTAAENAKLFDVNISVVWECNPWNGSPCGGTTAVPNLPAGQYFLSVQSDVCDEWIPITLDGNGATDSDGDGVPDNLDCQPNDPNLPAPVGSSCNDFDNNTIDDKIGADGCTCSGTPVGGVCNVSWAETGFGEITISGMTSAENTKIFDSNANSSGIVWTCNPWSSACTGNEVVTGLIPGEQYYLAVQSDDCSEWIPFMIFTVPLDDDSDVSFRKNEVVEEAFSITNLFPNPVSSEAFVSLQSNFDGEFSIEIYNTLGGLQSRSVSNIEAGNNNIELELGDLETGIYHLIISDHSGQTQSIRFVKQSN